MKKSVSVFVALFCCAFFYAVSSKAQIPAAYQVGTWKNFKPAAVTYTFDDNTSNQIPVAIPLLNTYGFKSTIFAVTQSMSPNWANMKTAANAGHEIGSHTVTHNNLNGAAISAQDTELKNSQATINSNITTQKCYTVAYPNCNIGDVSTIQKYYIAGRTCSGQIIPSSPTDFYNLSSIICGNTGVNTANDMNTRVNSAKTSGGWCVFLIHGIDGDGGYSPLASSVLSSHLSYVNTNTADYWVGTFGNVAKYIKERNAMSIAETTVTADSLRMTPTDNLDNTIYDAAITIRRQLPSGWTAARVMQAGTIITSTIVTVNTVKYVQFDVVPDKGVYTLANAAVTNPGCATAAPTVSPVSFVQGAAATALTATGTALKWYGTNATAGTASTTAPTPSTTAAGSTTYYVSQTLNGCEGPRAALVVTVTASGTGNTSCNETGQGAYYTGVYRNMFKELLNKTDAEVKAKVDAAFQHFFYGSSTQKLYYEVGTDMAYIQDIANNDVRSEGMSYGLMICVQLDKKAEFDKLWKWTKTYMQHNSGNLDGFFRWQLNTNGGVIDNNPAPDGEAYFITALFFAANRWGNGTGIYNYSAEAQAALSKVQSKTGAGGINSLFNTNSKLITFGPNGGSYDFTDPSYNLPGFFELWGRWSTSNTAFWQQTPAAARKLIRDASHSTSGLTADYSNFDGTPKTTSFNSDSHRFMYDAWRTIMNLGMDYHWFKVDAQQPVIAERYLNFFKNQGSNYKNHYDWNGSNAGGDHSTGLVACNAVASLAVTNTTLTTPFVQEFWSTGLPTGTYRYYDGMLYLLGMLNCSGNFKVWKPECPNTCATPAPTVAAAVINYDLNAAATALTATGTAVKWYTVATGGTALTTAPTPSTSVTGTTVYYAAQTLNGCEGPRVSVTVNVVNNYKIYKVSAPVAVDGTVDEVWNNVNVLPAAATKLLSGTVTNSADLSGNFKALWDDTYLYILADITDDVKISESTNAYDDDGVEVYIDINNDKATTYGTNDFQYTFGWNKGTTVSVLPAGRSVAGITYTAVARTGGYIIEARIPWATIQGTPAAGQLVGIDFMINDDDDNGVRDGKLSWNAATDNAWQDPSLFGTAILQGAVPCTTPAAPTVTATAAYCQNAPATALTATGTGLKWYTAATGGTSAASLTPETGTVGTINYYVSQTVSGCESSRAEIAVTVNALPAAVITPGGATTFCSGGSVTLTSSTGTSYVWKRGAIQVGTTATYAATESGSYTVEVTNANTCKATSAATTVTVNAAPAAPTVSATAAYCQNAAAAALTATGTGLKWYTASTGGTAAATLIPETATVGLTNYYVSQTVSGCESPRAVIAVTINALPAATITAGSATTFCAGGSVTLTASTGTSYVWKNGNTPAGTAATYVAASAGSYTVEVTNTNNCKAVSAATVVAINSLPSAPAVTATAAYCQQATAIPLTATGTALKWYETASGGTALANTPIPSTAATGNTSYYVSQTTNGCESPRAMITVTVNELPAATITPTGSTAILSGGSVLLNANTGSGLSYKWFRGTTPLSTASSYAATSAGDYTVEVTNANNCKMVSAVTTVTVTTNQPSVITITSPANNTNVSSPVLITVDVSDPDGSIELVEFLDGDIVIGTAASEPYSFTWNDPGTGSHTITVRVKDSNGGITTSSPVIIFTGITTGISSGNSMYSNVYPVPARDEVIVETDLDLSGATVKVVSILGEEVSLPVAINGTDAKLNVAELSDGTYILIINQQSNVITKKISIIK
jgi:endo-1,4-beta-D-glucanase Y